MRALRHKPTGQLIVILSICFAFAGAASHLSFAQTNYDKLAKQLENEKKKLDSQKNPADRTQSLMKIADITLIYLRDAITANDLGKMNACADEYRETVREARDTMMSSGLDPSKKPKGYKAIELGTRVQLRLLADSIRSLSVDDRAPLEDTIDEVSNIRSEMLRLLFP